MEEALKKVMVSGYLKFRLLKKPKVMYSIDMVNIEEGCVNIFWRANVYL